jgi:hypothetical protein
LEDETQKIVKNARQTIEKLETESDSINKSFQRYLEKQRHEKSRFNNAKMKIWQNYSEHRLALQQRELLENQNFENPYRGFDAMQYLKRMRENREVSSPKILVESTEKIKQNIEASLVRLDTISKNNEEPEKVIVPKIVVEEPRQESRKEEDENSTKNVCTTLLVPPEMQESSSELNINNLTLENILLSDSDSKSSSKMPELGEKLSDIDAESSMGSSYKSENIRNVLAADADDKISVGELSVSQDDWI